MGDIDVTDDTVFGHAASGMNSIVNDFQSGMQATAQNSASPAAAGTMPEGQAFMQSERQGREKLVEYMTKTSDGLHGYQSAIQTIGSEYAGLVQLNKSRLQALLKPNDAAVPVSPVFDWHNAVKYQIENPPGGH